MSTAVEAPARRKVLEVEDVRTRFHTRDGTVYAVNGISFDLREGELLGVVGESGSGKSVTMMSLLKLLPMPPAEIVSGRARLDGEDLLGLDPKDLRRVRGARVGFIFQDPMTSLNPVLTVGYQLAEPLRVHLGMSRAAARRRALSLAIDRQILVEAGYGAAGQATCNVLPAPAVYASTANDECLTQDVDEANGILDEAGWMSGGDGVRAKDGVRLSILYQTSINSVRQGTQALIKQMWEQIGVETELRNVDAAVFFGGDPASPDTYMKFYADIEMYTNNFSGTDPESYMANWACSEIPGPENQWLGNNIPRSCVAEYDALVAEMSQTASLEERARLAKQMNGILVQNHYMIPLIWRANVSAHANTLKGVRMNAWDSELWNAADWHR